jgi:methionyl-tRNA formyltransferase
MRVAFAGTAPFAERVLAGLLGSRHAPVVVVTNPDRPRGRHGTPQPPGVKIAALAAGLPVLQPARVAEADAVAAMLAFTPHVFVACAYGQIVGAALLDALPCLVVHPSPVPRWRGAAPVERALMAGETRLGVATLRMTAGVDEGPVADERSVVVPADADAGTVYERLAPVAVESLLATLDGMEDGSVRWRAQTGPATYAEKITAADRELDWTRPAETLGRQVRALAPHIGAVTDLLGKRTIVWRARPGHGALPPPSPDRLVVATGDGWLEVLELQQEGRRRMRAAEFLRGAGRALAGP